MIRKLIVGTSFLFSSLFLVTFDIFGASSFLYTSIQYLTSCYSTVANFFSDLIFGNTVQEKSIIEKITSKVDHAKGNLDKIKDELNISRKDYMGYEENKNSYTTYYAIALSLVVLGVSAYFGQDFIKLQFKGVFSDDPDAVADGDLPANRPIPKETPIKVDDGLFDEGKRKLGGED